MKYRALAINPGSTSTKIAVFDDEKEVFSETLRHDAEKIEQFDGIIDQFQFRKEIVLDALEKHDVKPESLEAVVGRGGLVRPVTGGTFKVSEKMLNHLKDPSYWGRIHASNLGAFISNSIASEYNIPAFIVDPVTVDEFDDIARISGVPEIERKSLFHALNIRFTARKVAKQLNKNFKDMNMIAVHMGGGISVAPIKKGRVVDVNNALLGMGPFSPQRAGALPIGDLLDLAYSGEYTKKELTVKLAKKSGLLAYLGTDDGKKIQEDIEKGDKKSKLIFDAMIYQIAKEIGASAAVLKGNVDAIILTGGLAYGDYLVNLIKERTEFIAKVFVEPGENEMEALCQGGIRVLKGEEEALDY